MSLRMRERVIVAHTAVRPFRYAIIISKVLPETASSHPVYDAVKGDTYYCLLLPLVAVPSFVAIYLNWMAMRFYSHN